MVSEKEMYLQRWNQELHVTVKVLKAFPEDKMDFTPHERSRTARDLAWTFVMEETLIDQVVKGAINFGSSWLKPPATMAEIIALYEKQHAEMYAKVTAMSDDDFNALMPFPTGPGTMGEIRKGGICWMMLMDMIHHRGQFSVYLRMTGAKVPSIYGPSADEPWR